MSPRLHFEDVIGQAEPISVIGNNNIEEIAELTVMSWYEATFNPGMQYIRHLNRKINVTPFGLTSIYRREGGVERSMEYWAIRALQVFETAQHQCGNGLEYRYGFYFLGRCTSVEYSQREARTTRRIIRRLRVLTTEN